MARSYLEVKEFEGRKYYYLDVGSGWHGEVSFRLWVNAKLVKFNESGEAYVEFPAQNARIVKTEKGNLVLRPEEGWFVYDVGIGADYRETSTFKLIGIAEGEADIYPYEIYHSPVGSLGISNYALVSTQLKKIKIEWDSGCARGVSVYYPDGSIEEVDNVDIEELEGDAL